MNQRELLEYVRGERMRSTPAEQIIAHLTATGYPTADVEKALAALERDPSAGLGVKPHFLKRHHPLRMLLVILVCLAGGLGILGLLITKGIVVVPIQQVPSALPVGTDDQSLMPPTAPAPASIPPTYVPAAPAESQTPASVAPASSGVSADDMSQIIDALLTQDTVLQSTDAQDVRDYLRIMAPSADQAKISAMSDSAVLAYAAGLLDGTGDIGAAAWASPQVAWQRTSASTVSVTIPAGSGFATRSSTQLNGVWY